MTNSHGDRESLLVLDGIDRTLGLLLDFGRVADQEDDDALKGAIDDARALLKDAQRQSDLDNAIERCRPACDHALGRLETAQTERRQEMVALVNLVREALGVISSGGGAVDDSITSSAHQIEGLADIADINELKGRLMGKITELRHVAEQRHKAWQDACAGFGRKVTTLERQLRSTKTDAALDALTQISNRRTFDDHLNEWVAAGQAFTIALIDFDRFKDVNDTHGHAVGDKALQATAQSLTRSLRKSDIVARVGGDEFAVLAGGMALKPTMLRMRMAGATLGLTRDETGGAPVRITLSVGVAERTAGDDVEALKARADAALYEAKRLGRNRVVGKTADATAAFVTLTL